MAGDLPAAATGRRPDAVTAEGSASTCSAVQRAAVLAFTKMHGAGNDFVVLDLRDRPVQPDQTTLARLADRHFGVGCDQVMILLPSTRTEALASYRIVNGDGSDARQCGNGVRCLAAWLQARGELSETAVLDSPSGPVPIHVRPDGGIEVSLGVPAFQADAIPMTLARQQGRHWLLQVADHELAFGAVSMGNPHVVIEVEDVLAAPVELALDLQGHAAFPEGCNVGFVEAVARDRMRLRVIERGVGETLACGSGACAAHAWLRRLDRVDARTTIELPGGNLSVHWQGGSEEPVRLGGPTAFVFEGQWPG